MSVRRLSSLIRGLGYRQAEVSSAVSRPVSPPSTSDDLAKLVALKPRDMAIVYSPKPGGDD